MRTRRRPSASMVVALLALFASLGGVGYAATFLPAGSVGTTQLRNGSVSNAKIQNGSVGNFKLAFGAIGPRKMENAAVGLTQINTSEVQARVTGACAAGAISSVTATGTVTCSAATPQEFDTSSASPVTVPAGTTATPITSESLAGGSSYLVLANPYVHLTNATAGQQVEVDCTLAVGPATTAVQTRSWTVEIGANAVDQTNAIPLEVTAPSSANTISANVSCTREFTGGTTSPTITVTSNINSLQTAANTTATPAG
jgi:hypothetical protein